MAINATDLRFFLTDPTGAATSPARSLGGLPSATVAFPSSTLASGVTSTATSITVADGAAMAGARALLVGDEIMHPVTRVGSTAVYSVSRGATGLRPRAHAAGTPVLAVGGASAMFGPSLPVEGREFRCVALVNTSTTEAAYGVSVYLRTQSRNPEGPIRFAVEVPRNDRLTGTVASTVGVAVTDPAISTAFADNSLVGSAFTVTSGARVGFSTTVLSYDRTSRTLVLSAKPEDGFEVGSSYAVAAGPSQRVAFASDVPVLGAGRASALSTVPVSIDVGNGLRAHRSTLLPGDAVYVWVERRVAEGAAASPENRFILGVRYSLT